MPDRNDAELLALQARAAQCGMSVAEYEMHQRWASLPWSGSIAQERAARARRPRRRHDL